MSVYDANFSTITLNGLPPQKRNPINIAYMGVFASDFQYLHDSIFGQYMNGFTGSAWAAGTYTIGQQVWYIDNAVYEVQVASTTATPGASSDWLKILNNRIGAIERQSYTGCKLILEYALNRWFNTTFRQPSSVPDIYIVNSNASDNWFAIGRSTPNTSSIAKSTKYSDFGIGRTFTYPPPVDFTIYVPLAVYNALASNNTDRTNIIRQFVNNYVIAGITYSVTTY